MALPKDGHECHGGLYESAGIWQLRSVLTDSDMVKLNFTGNVEFSFLFKAACTALRYNLWALKMMILI